MFDFKATPAFTATSSVQTFELVADSKFEQAPAQWVGTDGTGSIQANVVEPSTNVQLKYKSPDPTIAKGQSQPLEIDFTNTGTTPLDPTLLYLDAHVSSSDYAWCLYTDDGNWISPVYIIPKNTAMIEPGQDAIFQFIATPDSPDNGACPAGPFPATFELKFIVPFLRGYDFGTPGTATINVTVTN